MYDLRMQIFSHIQKLDIKYFDSHPVGRLMTRITTDIDVLNELFTAGVVSIFGDIFFIDWNRFRHALSQLETCIGMLFRNPSSFRCNTNFQNQSARFVSPGAYLLGQD